MAFDNVTFPSPPLGGLDVRREVIDPVSVSTNGSYEYRVRRQRWERFIWTIPTQTMTNTQKEEMRTFLSARSHGLNSFKYDDTELSTFDDAILEHNNGAWWNVAIPLGTSTPGTHPMFATHWPSLSVTVNGGAGSLSGFSLQNGVPCVAVSGTTGTEVVRITGSIPFVVRLGSNFQEAMLALCSDDSPRGHSVNSIKLVEVYGEY